MNEALNDIKSKIWRLLVERKFLFLCFYLTILYYNGTLNLTGLAISCTIHVNLKGYIERTLQSTLYAVLDSRLIFNLSQMEMRLFFTSREWLLVPSANLGQFKVYVLTISVSCSYYHFPHLFTLYIEYRNTTFCMKFVSLKEGASHLFSISHVILQ